jgi:hypothetical protein
MSFTIEKGNAAIIWHGVEPCQSCGSRLMLRWADIHCRIEATETDVTGDDAVSVRTLYWFTCRECGSHNYISAEEAMSRGMDHA